MKYLIAIICVLSVLLAITTQRACTTQNSQADTTIIVNKHYDSAAHTIQTTPQSPNHPILISTTTTLTDTFFKDVDTSAIISQWLLTTNYYQQNYRDSIIDLVIYDSIRRNEITSRQITYKVIRPCIDTVKTIVLQQRQKIQWYVGSDFIFGSSTGIAPKLMVIDKKNRAYSINTNVFQPQPNATIGVAFKIK